MTRDEVLAVLRAHEAELRRRGVMHVALFGSLARGEAHPDSDIDVMVELDPDARISLWSYVGLKTYVQALFSGPVDVVSRTAIDQHLRPAVERDARFAF